MGKPEVEGTEDLIEVVLALFIQVLGAPDSAPMTIKLHCALGPRLPDPSRPRDIICRLHHYTKETSQKTRRSGPVDFQGNMVRILPDLS